MKILILTGIAQELRAILQYWEDRHQEPFTYDKQGRFFILPYAGHVFYAGSAGPGLPRPAHLLRRLEWAAPDVIVSAGLVGVLRPHSAIPVGQELTIRAVQSHNEPTVYPGGPGRFVLLSVDRPIFDPGQKHDLARASGADLCDMEAYRLLKLCGRSPLALQWRIVLLKIAGDLPEQADLFRYEDRLRTRPGSGIRDRLGSWLVSVRHYRLLRIKKKGLLGLGRATEQFILSLKDMSDLPPARRSVFLPHIR
ncbi:MAG: hypothetical protein HS115_17540 [Spirochaetales bacterium]|nr:hypothetical protein [Spirochaetales bacterium]